MSTCRLRVLAGRSGVLLIHPGDSGNPGTFGDGGSAPKDGELLSGVPGGMGLLNKIYGLVQAGRCLLNIFCWDKFEESEAGRRVFCKFDDGEVDMVVFVHADDILTHAQATMERFTAERGETFRW